MQKASPVLAPFPATVPAPVNASSPQLLAEINRRAINVNNIEVLDNTADILSKYTDAELADYYTTLIRASNEHMTKHPPKLDKIRTEARVILNDWEVKPLNKTNAVALINYLTMASFIDQPGQSFMASLDQFPVMALFEAFIVYAATDCNKPELYQWLCDKEQQSFTHDCLGFARGVLDGTLMCEGKPVIALNLDNGVTFCYKTDVNAITNT